MALQEGWGGREGIHMYVWMGGMCEEGKECVREEMCEGIRGNVLGRPKKARGGSFGREMRCAAAGGRSRQGWEVGAAAAAALRPDCGVRGALPRTSFLFRVIYFYCNYLYYFFHLFFI